MPKIKFLKLGLTALVLGLAIWVGMLGWSLLTTAQGAEGTAEEEKTCADEVKVVMQEELESFAAFMKDHFANEAANTHLLRGAMDRLKLLRQRVMDAYNEYYTKNVDDTWHDDEATKEENEKNRLTYLSQLKAATECHQAIDIYFSYMVEVARENMTFTAGGKKATLLVNKYKAVNERLNSFAFEVAKMAGLFKAFDSRLPCCEKSQAP